MSDTTMTMADGTVIDMLTGRVVNKAKVIEVPTHSAAVAEITRVRKRVHDLPEAPERMNAIALVAMYYMYGLNEFDIAFVTNLTTEQVERIKSLDAFTKMVDAIGESVVEGQAENVRNTINAHASTAVRKVADLIDSEDEKVAIVAAKDILDRAGHRPADVVEHRHKVEGGLTIEYVKRDLANESPAIEIEYKELEAGDGS